MSNWQQLREDIAPVWAAPDPARLKRLGRIVAEVGQFQTGRHLPPLLAEARYLEVIEALLRWVLAVAHERQNRFAAAKRRRKEPPWEWPPETEPAERDLLSTAWWLGEMETAECDLLSTTGWLAQEPEKWRGRWPELANDSAGRALMAILRVAGYDKHERPRKYKTDRIDENGKAVYDTTVRRLNIENAADMAVRMVEGLGDWVALPKKAVLKEF